MDSYEPCRQYLQSDCSSQLPADHHCCPYLLLYGFTYITGSVMIKCSIPINRQIVACLPGQSHKMPSMFSPMFGEKTFTISTAVHIGYNLSNKVGSRTNMPFNTKNLTVVRIQQSDYVCPPNWHQMANMCFSLPHLIHKNNGQVDLPYCFCDFVGSHMHLINDINKRNITASAEEKDPLFTKYFNMLSETYSGKLYIR